MSELEGLHSSLESMDFQGLAFAFVAIAGYTVALNGLFSARSRGWGALVAVVGGIGFAATMSEWIEGVMLIALMIAAMGLFVGIVWTLSALCGLTRRPEAVAAPSTLSPPLASEFPADADRSLGLTSHGSHAHTG